MSILLVVDRDIAENIFTDVREFIDNPQWYMDRGVRYNILFI